MDRSDGPAPRRLRVSRLVGAAARDGGRERGSRGDLELGEDVAHVSFDRLLGEEELRGDLAVAASQGDQLCDLALATAQAAELTGAAGAALTGRRAPPQPAQLTGGLVPEAVGAAGGELGLGPRQGVDRRLVVARSRERLSGERARPGGLEIGSNGVRLLDGAFGEQRGGGCFALFEREKRLRMQDT
jgi:hypothetical protein